MTDKTSMKTSEPVELAETLASIGFEQTQAGEALGAETLGAETLTASLGRTTILPRQSPGEGGGARLSLEPLARYEPVRLLGEGAEGEVMLVKDNDINRHVAMKRLKAERHSAAQVARFVDEIQTIGQLEHPNIVPIHDVGVTEEGTFFFIMKHIDGDTLEEIISRLAAGDAETHARFPFSVRLALFQDILEAVAFAHKRGIIHRDLKPANIIVGRHGEVVVMDWGLAKVLGSAVKVESDASAMLSPRGKPDDDAITARLHETRQGELVGTPLYMAPEQALSMHDALDQRTDLYALSVLFYELLTLTHPLREKRGLVPLLLGVIHEAPEKAYKLEHPHQSRVPVEYWYFVEKGMAKAPEDRYQSAQEMLAETRKVSMGCYDVRCVLTGAKRAGHVYIEFIDKHPDLMTRVAWACFALLALALVSVGVACAAHLVGTSP